MTGTTAATATVFLLLLVANGSVPVIAAAAAAAAAAWNIVLAGGTGPVGTALSSPPRLREHAITILARNGFLAATPSRVTKDYGWVGRQFLQQNRNVQIRDWDGGDLLDIVGNDWMGWQSDVLPTADVIVHLNGGGFTQQRVMACERLVRETLAIPKTVDSHVLHITVNPTNELLSTMSPGMPDVKRQRIATCEAMVQQNCRNHICLRVDEVKMDVVCDMILSAIENWKPPASV